MFQWYQSQGVSTVHLWSCSLLLQYRYPACFSYPARAHVDMQFLIYMARKQTTCKQIKTIGGLRWFVKENLTENEEAQLKLGFNSFCLYGCSFAFLFYPVPKYLVHKGYKLSLSYFPCFSVLHCNLISSFSPTSMKRCCYVCEINSSLI